MRNVFLLFCVFLMFQTKIFALKKEDTPLFEKNYIQISPFFLDYHSVTAGDNKYNENDYQLITSRPSVLFYFNMDNTIFRTFISIDPSISTNQGSFAVGKLFNHTFDLGLYTLLNHIEHSTGSGSTENGSVKSMFLLGPYLTFYPYINAKSFVEIDTRLTYEYVQDKETISGSTSDVSEQKGVNFNCGVQYSRRISDKIYYSPNANFTFFITADTGGANTERRGVELQVIPVSFQMNL